MRDAKNVLEMLYEDIPNDIPCKVHIYGYYKNHRILVSEGYAQDVYEDLLDTCSAKKLCEARLQYLCYCPADGFLELDFVRPLYNG